MVTRDSSTIVNYGYLPKQRQFFQNCDEVPFSAYIGGYGSGKTHCLILQVLREAQHKTYGLVGAPTYTILRDTTQRKFFELCPANWIRRYSKGEMKVDLVNGTEIIFRSLREAGPLTNLTLNWFALDEIGLIDEDVFRMLQGRLRAPDGERKGFGSGNPSGPTHWTYEHFVEKAKEFPDTYRLVQATSYENTTLPEEFTQRMEQSFGQDSMYYKRYVLGEFVAFEGAYWPHFDIRPYPVGHVLQDGDIFSVFDDMSKVKFGRVLDFGYEHPWTLLWWACDGEKIVFYDEYWKKHGLIRDHCQEIRHREIQHRQWLGHHRPTITYTDHAAQDRAEVANCLDEKGNHIGFGCTIADKKVMPGILLVQTLIGQQRFFVSSRCKHALKELPAYRAKPIEKTDKEQPIKEQDDTCDCVRMACQMLLSHVLDFKRSATPKTNTTYRNADQLVRSVPLIEDGLGDFGI